ncbi:MAG: MauE/DoxX family redox-associated membrane protein [Candidatus Kapabacteria bacterium]|nr:MauE/DoxX family redox-associated membrane protein [Candidatus Kapabacteria bacterium]
MKKILGNPILILIVRLIVGYIFISYGIGKIANADKFAGEIANYALMPQFSLNILAITLPWIEVAAGFLLVFGIRLKSGSVITGGMMLVFIIAIIWAIAMGLDINCGCSSTTPQKVGLPKLLENTGLLLLSLLIYLFPERKFTLESFIVKQ